MKQNEKQKIYDAAVTAVNNLMQRKPANPDSLRVAFLHQDADIRKLHAFVVSLVDKYGKNGLVELDYSLIRKNFEEKRAITTHLENDDQTIVLEKVYMSKGNQSSYQGVGVGE